MLLIIYKDKKSWAYVFSFRQIKYIFGFGEWWLFMTNLWKPAIFVSRGLQNVYCWNLFQKNHNKPANSRFILGLQSSLIKYRYTFLLTLNGFLGGRFETESFLRLNAGSKTRKSMGPWHHQIIISSEEHLKSINY